MNKKIILLSSIIVILLILSSCSTDNTALDALESELENAEKEISSLKEETEDLETLSNPPSQSANLVNEAFTVLNHLANEDGAALANHAHPSRGVRFSPYFNVNVNTDIVFYPGNTIGANMFTNTTVYVWGEYDGTGDTIAGEYASYHSRFVYDEDYLNPDIIGINAIVGTGNTNNNIENIYPNESYVEFHFTGFDPQFMGMDWRSLVLVFKEDNGDWYLVGIVHGEWTA